MKRRKRPFSFIGKARRGSKIEFETNKLPPVDYDYKETLKLPTLVPVIPPVPKKTRFSLSGRNQPKKEKASVRFGETACIKEFRCGPKERMDKLVASREIKKRMVTNMLEMKYDGGKDYVLWTATEEDKFKQFRYYNGALWREVHPGCDMRTVKQEFRHAQSLFHAAQLIQAHGRGHLVRTRFAQPQNKDLVVPEFEV